LLGQERFAILLLTSGVKFVCCCGGLNKFIDKNPKYIRHNTTIENIPGTMP